MPQRPDSRPDNALMPALVLVGGALLVALILVIFGVFREGGSKEPVWYGVVLAAYLMLRRVRQLRRQRRPEWLETQSWHQGMAEQVRKQKQRGSVATPPGPDSGAGPGKT